MVCGIDVINQNIALAIAVPAFVAAIILMFARFFESKQLEQAAKTELVFAGSTVILVMAIIILLPVACNVFLEIGKELVLEANCLNPPCNMPNYDNLIDLTVDLMQPHYACMREAMGMLYYASTFFEMSSTTYIEVFMSEVSSGFIYKMFTERIINFTNALTFYIYVYFIMVQILYFMKSTALVLFLPIGILMRAFPPTRGAGAYVIAFSIGIYLIFPISYIVMAMIPSDYTSSAKVMPIPFGGTATSCTMLNKISEDETASSLGALDPSKPKEAESWAKRHMAELEGFFSGLSGYFKKLTISLCLVPLMAMVVTLSFVLSSTSLFGGNIPEVGRGLVKLI